jgi:hypothetical protein
MHKCRRSSTYINVVERAHKPKSKNPAPADAEAGL